jgi:hypothetical protein
VFIELGGANACEQPYFTGLFIGKQSMAHHIILAIPHDLAELLVLNERLRMTRAIQKNECINSNVSCGRPSYVFQDWHCRGRRKPCHHR